MSREIEEMCITRNSFPRVSGDEPPATQAFDPTAEFSPRERG